MTQEKRALADAARSGDKRRVTIRDRSVHDLARARRGGVPLARVSRGGVALARAALAGLLVVAPACDAGPAGDGAPAPATPTIGAQPQASAESTRVEETLAAGTRAAETHATATPPPAASPAPGVSLLDLLTTGGLLERAAWSTPRVMTQSVRLETQPQPGFVKVQVPPAGAVLELDYGVKPERWSDVRSGPFRFAIAVLTPRKGNDRGGRQIVFEQRIDPARVPADRRWHEARVDLDPFAGSEIMLVFMIDTPTLVEPPGDLAGWRDPRIVPREGGDAQATLASPDGTRRNADTPTR